VPIRLSKLSDQFNFTPGLIVYSPDKNYNAF
jgi:hypothetical protein